MKHEVLAKVMVESTCLWPCRGGTRLLNARARLLPGGLGRLRPSKNESIQRLRVAQSSVDLLDSLDLLEDESLETSLAGERDTGLHSVV